MSASAPTRTATATGTATATATETGTEIEAALRAEQLGELRKVFRQLFRSISRLRGRDTHLSPGELSHAQYELLIELQDRGDLPAGELASAARLAPGSVTQMLDHLAECGHVERVRSLSDRRVVVSRLTPQGRRKIAAKRAAHESRWEQALLDLDHEELRAATRVIERLCTMVEETPVPGCPAPAAGTLKQARKASP
jgi:DNA-binding MarR family transcriptional regulator